MKAASLINGARKETKSHMGFTLREDLERAIEKYLLNIQTRTLRVCRGVDWAHVLAPQLVKVLFDTIQAKTWRGEKYIEPMGDSMSAIISGWQCKDCKEKYWISLGHPKWFDDVIKKGEPKNATFELFEDIQKSGRCLTCYLRREKLLCQVTKKT